MKKYLLVLAALCFAGVSSAQQGTTASNTGAFTIAGTGSTQVLAAVAGTRIRISGLGLFLSATSNVTLQYGTGTTCGTGTGSLSGAMPLTTFNPPLTGGAPITLPVGQAFCINSSSAATGAGYVIYSRY